MRPRYLQALVAGSLGVAAVIWDVAGSGQYDGLSLLIGSAALPIAVLLAVSGRLEANPPIGSLLGGATIGPLVAVLSHFFVFGFAYAFFLGFADAATVILENLRVDPAFVELASSPWTLLVFFEFVLVAPFTEEVGKALGASFGHPMTRQTAFFAGVAAGVGFAIVENLVYAGGGLFFGPAWGAIAGARMLGAAIHPLASGLVVMGWWEWRHGRDFGLLLRRFLSGVGVHAVWNGSIVVLGVVGEVYGIDQLRGLGTLAITYAASLGVIAMAILWRLANSVASGDERSTFDGTNPISIGAWVVAAASLLVPVALLFLAYPEFVGG